MKKNTKIFNTEVIERSALSDNIPPFDEQRNGTQVIMIEEGKKTVIYDDYSMYCDADARKWRVEAYNMLSQVAMQCFMLVHTKTIGKPSVSAWI